MPDLALKETAPILSQETGWSYVLIVREGNRFFLSAVKNGRRERLAELDAAARITMLKGLAEGL